MKGKRAFCECCREDTAYRIVEMPMVGRLKGKEYHYIGKEARCMECNSPMYIRELNDANLKALYDSVRREKRIIEPERIAGIIKKYHIGKRPLSLLLGWGEQTVSRYLEGDIPTKQYSDELIKIYSDPVYYKEILEQNKSNITELAYTRSKKAVDENIEMSETARINVVIKYLLNQCGDITPLVLQKVLYYVQGFYYAFYKVFLFKEDCEAWVHGPVYREIYYRYQNYHFDPIAKTEVFDQSVLNDSEKAILDSVINSLCCYSGKILERFTHNEKPWIDARGDLPVDEPSDRIIPRKAIGEYFTMVKKKYKMINPSDIECYATDMFQS